MGCDLSKKTKLEFLKQTNVIQNSINSIQTHQKDLKKSIDQIIIPELPEETVQDLKNSLIPHLERLESLIFSLKDLKSPQKKEDKADSSRKKFQISTKANSSDRNSKDRSESIQKEKNSILEDPMIKHLIEKNRKKLVAKK